MGFQNTEALLAKLPGADRQSVGVHANGCVQVGGSVPQPYMPFGIGDTISVVANRKTETLSCAKNGISMGMAPLVLPVSKTQFPCIGFDGGACSVRINLGTTPFKCAPSTCEPSPRLYQPWHA